MAKLNYDEVLKSLAAFGDISRKLENLGLTRDAIAILLKHKTGVPIYRINMILNEIDGLALWALTKKKP